jgi:antitoxin FitA
MWWQWSGKAGGIFGHAAASGREPGEDKAVEVKTLSPSPFFYAIILIARRRPMANVLIRDIPDEVVNDLKQMAKLHNRPLQQELREILVRTASQPYRDVARQAAEIRLRLAGQHRTFSDSAEMLREDRDR